VYIADRGDPNHSRVLYHVGDNESPPASPGSDPGHNPRPGPCL
jgi:hypothetical protein